jgi:ribosomal-protein-alanine N-acetyltransferase
MLETARLAVRPLVAGDYDRLCELRRDPEVGRYLGVAGPFSIEDFMRARLGHYIDHYARHGYAMGGVSLKPSPALIGFGGLQRLDDGEEIEVGYILGREYWGRGLATELARGWLAWGFDHLRVDRIVAVADPANTASRHVMEKLGMRYEKNIRHYGMDSVYYAVSREEFRDRGGAGDRGGNR